MISGRAHYITGESPVRSSAQETFAHRTCIAVSIRVVCLDYGRPFTSNVCLAKRPVRIHFTASLHPVDVVAPIAISTHPFCRRYFDVYVIPQPDPNIYRIRPTAAETHIQGVVYARREGRDDPELLCAGGE